MTPLTTLVTKSTSALREEVKQLSEDTKAFVTELLTCLNGPKKEKGKKMRYGKIRIEDGFFVFTRHMMLNSLPCKDILWAYMRREGTDKTGEKQLIINYLVIITRRQKRYKFDMTEQEVQDCLQLLKVLNPDLAVGLQEIWVH